MEEVLEREGISEFAYQVMDLMGVDNPDDYIIRARHDRLVVGFNRDVGFGFVVGNMKYGGEGYGRKLVNKFRKMRGRDVQVFNTFCQDLNLGGFVFNAIGRKQDG
ncbi:hypothetical protein COU62_04705 [Candidatus Pacearchaeota archaeon CG10_big_fil_rev_8_21_14_0_10_35_219]|nr:hypothetical protein [Candidatus Pacearchaeota archaeon]OIO42905.1 MAG: hypothetical protein AUJ63_01695 [Candidatus Pacearchaeota archaeon CG1_02_35_32]PIO07103.1 MAG: hypothetical protein COU62_04705 [Candidatus Pacearchaeota archaeon CG10_big_fil_rev_8_21_14_0_10_35_219]PIY81646.1 MAG: hypothetical protein COY79_01480 [Candidatus Pacearchaeota archaeon CG_4_10_14_0_8_um_filter_35_169]PIZ80898.1 MAG: hypothetical protein COY00_00060 [Candidatus Pacearchaeota archaeon CG_4_10_14_0_2_um_filt